MLAARFRADFSFVLFALHLVDGVLADRGQWLARLVRWYFIPIVTVDVDWAVRVLVSRLRADVSLVWLALHLVELCRIRTIQLCGLGWSIGTAGLCLEYRRRCRHCTDGSFG